MDTESPEPAAAIAVKTRRSGRIDLKERFVEIDGARYAMSDVPEAVVVWCMLNGLRRHILSAKLPAAAWTALQAGELPSDGAGPKAKEIDPWRKAYAHALADNQAKQAGHKLKSPEHAALLEEATVRAVAMDRAALAKVKTNPAVVTHWNRITGNEAVL